MLLFSTASVARGADSYCMPLYSLQQGCEGKGYV